MSPARKQCRRTETEEADLNSLSGLISGLHSLHDGPAYVNRLIAYGRQAIPALAELLLNGKPSGVPQPRQWTVEALAGLGACEVLLSYLSQALVVRGPIVQHGEEAVQNTAARALAACQTEETFTVLLDFLRRRALPGVVETIGLYVRPKAAPYLVDCLEDDVCRSAAMEALERLGDEIRPLLVESAIIRKPLPPDPESPSSIRRRRCCVRLMGPLHLTDGEASRIARLLEENDPDLVIAVAQLLLHASHFLDYRAVLFHVKRVQQTLGWWLQDESRSLISQIEEKVSFDAHIDCL